MGDDRPTIDEIAALPHVRRSICALGTTSRSPVDRCSHSGYGGEELSTDTELHGPMVMATRTATAPVPLWAIPTPRGGPVDLAEVESLLGESPAKRPRPRATSTPFKHSGT